MALNENSGEYILLYCSKWIPIEDLRTCEVDILGYTVDEIFYELLGKRGR